MFNRCCISIVLFVGVFFTHVDVNAQNLDVECRPFATVSELHSILSVQNINDIKSISSRLCVDIEDVSDGEGGVKSFAVKNRDDSKIFSYYMLKRAGGFYYTLAISPVVGKLCLDGNSVVSVFGAVDPVYRAVIYDFRNGRVVEDGFRPFSLRYIGFGDHKTNIIFNFLSSYCADEVSISQQIREGE